MVPTIYLVGIDDLERIPEFLDLGLIVVVSPDPTMLRRWQHEQELGEPVMDPPAVAAGVVVDMDARRIAYRGVPLTLSDREFRVLAGLVHGRDERSASGRSDDSDGVRPPTFPSTSIRSGR